MIAVLDYGMGNLRSMAKALEYVGGDVVVTSDAAVLRDAERIVLPGVGAFGQCAENLRATSLVDTLREEVICFVRERLSSTPELQHLRCFIR